MEKDLQYRVEENDNIIMGKTLFDTISERNYFAWVIGFDTLQLEPITKCMNDNGIYGCDILYDFCNDLADKYVKSEEYQDLKYSGYEMLYKYIENNGGIVKIFKEYFNIKEEK